VEGISHPRNNRFSGIIRIGQHASSGYPQDPEPVFLKKRHATFVKLCAVEIIVCTAIDFDDEALGQAAEVGDIRPDGMLPAKLVAARALTEALPEHALGL
jgi:hypothetical protein